MPNIFCLHIGLNGHQLQNREAGRLLSETVFAEFCFFFRQTFRKRLRRAAHFVCLVEKYQFWKIIPVKLRKVLHKLFFQKMSKQTRVCLPWWAGYGAFLRFNWQLGSPYYHWDGCLKTRHNSNLRSKIPFPPQQCTIGNPHNSNKKMARKN